VTEVVRSSLDLYIVSTCSIVFLESKERPISEPLQLQKKSVSVLLSQDFLYGKILALSAN